jgi:hypothetical protein
MEDGPSGKVKDKQAYAIGMADGPSDDDQWPRWLNEVATSPAEVKEMLILVAPAKVRTNITIAYGREGGNGG